MFMTRTSLQIINRVGKKLWWNGPMDKGFDCILSQWKEEIMD